MVEHSRARRYIRARGRARFVGSIDDGANNDRLGSEVSYLGRHLTIRQEYVERAILDFVRDPASVIAEERSTENWKGMQHVLNLERELLPCSRDMHEPNLLLYEIGLAVANRAIRLQRQMEGKPPIKMTKSPRHTMNARKISDEPSYREESLYLLARQQMPFMACIDGLPKDISPEQRYYFLRGVVDYNFMLQAAMDTKKRLKLMSKTE